MPESPDLVQSILIQDLLKEKKRDRFWKNFRFIVWFLLIGFIIYKIFSYPESNSKSAANNKNYVALIRLNGMIAPGYDFSAEEVIPLLKTAYEDKLAKGVLIDINSGGGTPVQAAIIHDAIINFKNKYHKKTIVVGEDMLTSGAYYVAVAGDKIYVNANTLTGSIGVIMKGFGFVDLMKKMGIERRVYVAGSNKDRLDPFLPQSPDDQKKIAEVMNEVHQNFTESVMKGRKDKLKAEPALLFSGDFWSGQSALRLGLVDAIGNLNSAALAEFQTEEMYEYTSSPGLWKFIGGHMSSAMDKLFMM